MTVAAMRAEVALRDVGCVAPRLDPGCGPCRDRWGGEMPDAPRFLSLEDGELDYVRRDALGPRHLLPEDHAWLCPGHHRGTGRSGGRVWATSHRAELADYLLGVRAAGAAS